MLNNKFISVGIIAVIVLAVIYLGNMAMRTTPEGGALGQTQYKVVPSWNTSDIQEQDNIGFLQLMENQLNKYAKDGWELVEVIDALGGQAFVLKKN